MTNYSRSCSLYSPRSPRKQNKVSDMSHTAGSKLESQEKATLCVNESPKFAGRSLGRPSLPTGEWVAESSIWQRGFSLQKASLHHPQCKTWLIATLKRKARCTFWCNYLDYNNTEDKILFKNASDEHLSNAYICFVNHLVSTNNSYAYSHQVAHGIWGFLGFSRMSAYPRRSWGKVAQSLPAGLES